MAADPERLLTAEIERLQRLIDTMTARGQPVPGGLLKRQQDLKDQLAALQAPDE